MGGRSQAQLVEYWFGRPAGAAAGDCASGGVGQGGKHGALQGSGVLQGSSVLAAHAGGKCAMLSLHAQFEQHQDRAQPLGTFSGSATRGSTFSTAASSLAHKPIFPGNELGLSANRPHTSASVLGNSSRPGTSCSRTAVSVLNLVSTSGAFRDSSGQSSSTQMILSPLSASHPSPLQMPGGGGGENGGGGGGGVLNLGPSALLASGNGINGCNGINGINGTSSSAAAVVTVAGSSCTGGSSSARISDLLGDVLGGGWGGTEERGRERERERVAMVDALLPSPCANASIGNGGIAQNTLGAAGVLGFRV